MIIITHDLGVVAGRTDHIAVMYAGRVVERGPTRALFHERRHHYTDGLLGCIPRLSDPGHTRLRVIPGRPPDLVDLPAGCPFAPRCRAAQPRCLPETPTLVEVGAGHEHACFFPVGTPEGDEALGRARVQAVSDVSFDVARGETLGLVGESGCGRSTTARAIMHAPRPTSGRVTFGGRDLGTLDGEALRRLRPEMQMIFQDPISSLNPRRRVLDIVAEGLSIWGRDDGTGDRVRRLLRDVGIDPEVAGRRRPHEFSGGQCLGPTPPAPD